MRRKKVLVEAYECSPLRQHAAGASWQIISRLARWFDLWVLTEQTQYAREVLEYLEQHPQLSERIHFHFIPRRKKGGFGRKRPPLPFREVLDAYDWQKRAFQEAQRLHEKIRFDISHHLRSHSFRQGGLLWKLGVPHIWGPMGGSRCVPQALFSGLDFKSQAEYRIRNLMNFIQLRCDPHVRNAVQTATCIFTQTSEDHENLLNIYGCDSSTLQEQGTFLPKIRPREYDGHRELNIAWVARCIPGKTLHFLLEAVAILQEKEKIQLHIVGDGPYLNRWKIQAEKLGVNNRCVYYGWVDPQRVNDIMCECDILAITSIQEGTPATMMNALSLGVPVLSLHHCGMKDIVTSDCGFPIPVDRPNRIAKTIANTIRQILHYPGCIEDKSRSALSIRKRYTWDSIAQTIRNAYVRALQDGASADAVLEEESLHCVNTQEGVPV